MARRPRRIELGGIPAFRWGGPSRFGDIYYAVMEMTWPAFVAVTAALFLGLNLIFGGLYALLPGSIANAEPGSLLDGFYFSVDTLGTVGYGSMYPATRAGHAVAAVEILTGLFFSATMTGLIFARFSRPRMSFAFSRVAVIGRFEGQPALMVRAASVRSRPLADAAAQMSWLETVEMADGRSFRRMTELPLLRSRNPMFGLAWTLVHIIEPDSAMRRALDGDERFTLSVTVSGIDTLLASQTQGGQRYGREDVLVDHEFVDILREVDGAMHLDLTRLDDAEPIGADGDD